MNDYIPFFDKKNMFLSEQFDFRSEQNDIDNLVENTEQIRHGSTDVFTCKLLDLRKACDSINHEIFLVKLGHHGVTGIGLKWFETCSKERLH